MTTPGTGDSPPRQAGAAGSISGPAPAPARKNLDIFLDDVLHHFETRSKAAAPQNLIITYVTSEYLARLDPTVAPNPQLIEQQLLACGNAVIKAENTKIPPGDGKLPLAKRLTYWQVAQILLALHHVIRIAPNAKDTDRDYDLLAMYRPDGPGRGTYTVSEDDVRTTARRYNTQLSLNDFKEVLAVLREDSPRTHQCSHRDLVAVGNGVFFYGTQDRDVVIDDQEFSFQAKSLHPFDPAMVFLAKSYVDYVDNAPKQVITHPVDRTGCGREKQERLCVGLSDGQGSAGAVMSMRFSDGDVAVDR